MKKQILVTGGAGYIGSHTVKYLLDKGYAVVVVDNLVYGHRQAVDARADFIQLDLADEAALDCLFKQYSIDAVIHFAAFASVGESMQDPQKYYFNNVGGTLHLLKVMLDNGVKKIVFSSSCATYGEPQYVPMDEQHPQAPINPYGQSKWIVEQIFENYRKAYGLQYIALRYFNAAGAAKDGSLGENHQPETHLIPLVLKALKNGAPAIRIFGTDYDTPDGTCIRDYIHVEDLAQAHYLALEKLSKYSGCLNLGTGQGTSVKEIIRTAEKVSGRPCPVEQAPRREGDPARLVASNQKARRILGWEPVYTDMEEIIRTAWNWELKLDAEK